MSVDDKKTRLLFRSGYRIETGCRSQVLMLDRLRLFDTYYTGLEADTVCRLANV